MRHFANALIKIEFLIKIYAGCAIRCMPRFMLASLLPSVRAHFHSHIFVCICICIFIYLCMAVSVLLINSVSVLLQLP